MGYKVNYKGLEVICDTFQDLDALAEHAFGFKSFVVAGRQAAVMPIQPVLPHNPDTPTNGSEEDSPMRSFIASLPQNTVDVLSKLVSNGAMSDRQLRTELNLDNNMQLAGRIAPVSRRAKKFGLSPDEILITKVVSSKPGHRKYEYQVPEGAKRFIRERRDG